MAGREHDVTIVGNGAIGCALALRLSAKHPSIVPNSSDGSALDMVLKVNVVGSTGTVASGGDATCNIDDSNPTLTLKH